MLDTLHSLREPLSYVYVALIVGLWLWGIVHVNRAQTTRNGGKGMWILLFFLMPGLGPLIYLLAGRERAA